MAKQKKKLSPDRKAAKKKRQKEYMTIFVNGKQKRVKRPPTIDSMDADEFITRNADPIWLHQNEMWEYMDQTEDSDAKSVFRDPYDSDFDATASVAILKTYGFLG
jgi:hypothetical protein